MTEVRTTFERLLADEPPMTTGLAPVVAAGQRLGRRSRLAYVAAGAAASLAVTAGAVTVVTSRERPAQVGVLPFAPLDAPPAAPAGRLTPRQQAIADAIVAASPAGWTFELGPDRWDGRSGVEATADDGAGPGRLLVGISTSTQLLHPCRDDEFRAGATCTERELEGGSVLTLRGLVDHGGIATVVAVLTHPDGSGVMAESGNFTLTWPLPEVVTSEQKRDLLRRSRPAPAYTAEQLARVVLAVDGAIDE